MKKRMSAVLMILCMLLCMHGVAYAAQSRPDAAQPDLTKECSITVYVKTFEGDPALDGKVELVKVATLKEGADGQYYETEPAFGVLDVDPVEKRSDKELPAKLEEIALSAGLPRTSAPISEGIAVFTGLTPGLYLLMQTEEVLESYTAIPPCLSLTPEDEDGVLKYDVDAFPKPVKTIPPDEVEFTGEKQIVCRNGQAPSGVTFSFVLQPENPDQPMPASDQAAVDPATGAAVVTREGQGSFSFGKMDITKEDIGKTYRYTMREVKGSALYFSYDVTIFTITVTVKDNGSGVPKAEVSIKDENNKTSRAVFTNVYTPPGKPDIPRTGQLWWPVAVLGAAGVVFVAIGLVLRRRREAE